MAPQHQLPGPQIISLNLCALYLFCATGSWSVLQMVSQHHPPGPPWIISLNLFVPQDLGLPKKWRPNITRLALLGSFPRTTAWCYWDLVLPNLVSMPHKKGNEKKRCMKKVLQRAARDLAAWLRPPTRAAALEVDPVGVAACFCYKFRR
eukprot:1160479-Pelagomonas_calceolata.AAC.10